MGRQGAHGFTLMDMAAGMAAIGVLGAIAVVGLGESRRQARTVFCEAKLGVIGMGNAAFAQSNNGLMAGFLSEENGRGTANAHAAEAVNILRTHGRPDMPSITGWVPDLYYWTLSLVEFENRSLSDPFNVCPSDDYLNKWRRHPAAFDAGRFLPLQPVPSDVNKRWPYSSSYEATGSAWDRNQSRDVGATSSQVVMSRLYQGGTIHSTFNLPGNHDVGPSPMATVAFPSRKAHVFEEHQRHFAGLDLYFMYDDARTTMLFFDGSVRVEQSGEANPGWIPNLPGVALVTSVIYTPSAWDPPVQNPVFGPQEVVQDSHRWTRSGLLGWDYLE